MIKLICEALPDVIFLRRGFNVNLPGLSNRNRPSIARLGHSKFNPGFL
jgi:hypothetical protein